MTSFNEWLKGLIVELFIENMYLKSSFVSSPQGNITQLDQIGIWEFHTNFACSLAYVGK